MTIRRRVVGRDKYSNAKLEVIMGDELPWKYDAKEEAYWVIVKDGTRYVVAKTRPEGVDRQGRKPFRYWMARVFIDGELIDLGDEYMNFFEGTEVCQLYESARHEPKRINSKSKAGQTDDDTRGTSEEQHQARIGRVRGLLPMSGSNGIGRGGS